MDEAVAEGLLRRNPVRESSISFSSKTLTDEQLNMFGHLKEEEKKSGAASVCHIS